MTLLRRLTIGTTMTAAMLVPAVSATAGQVHGTAGDSFSVQFNHSAGPFPTRDDCEMWRTEYYMQGKFVGPCELHPVKMQWFFPWS